MTPLNKEQQHEKIERDIRAFLKSGGKIQVEPPAINLPLRHARGYDTRKGSNL